MRRLLFLFLFFFAEATAMHPLFSSSRNVPNSFGRTHFIAGKRHYSSQVKNPVPASYVRRSKTLFRPKDDLLAEICKVISQAKDTIEVAAFHLTDERIAKQLIAAHERGVKVCVIMDAGNMGTKYSKAQKLIDNGICVLRYDPTLRKNYKKNNYEQIMHLKWIIADDMVAHGSANLTRAAQTGGNVESMTFSNCFYEVADHKNAFQDLKQYCVPCVKTSSTVLTNTNANK